MSDQIHLLIGANPWRPSGDADLVEEFDNYDMPTAGVVAQSGCYFLFECVEGIALAANVWLYAPITESEEEQLSRLSGSKLAQAMDEVWGSRDATVALAEGDAIRTGGTVSQHLIEHRGPRAAAVSALQAILKEMDASGALDAAS